MCVCGVCGRKNGRKKTFSIFAFALHPSGGILLLLRYWIVWFMRVCDSQTNKIETIEPNQLDEDLHSPSSRNTHVMCMRLWQKFASMKHARWWSEWFDWWFKFSSTNAKCSVNRQAGKQRPDNVPHNRQICKIRCITSALHCNHL